MFQIDVPSAVPALPAPAAEGQPGYFTEGDPVGGLPATVLSGDFMNTLMMELLNILAGVGVAPSKTNNDQIASAMPVFVSNANGKSLKFPSGVIFNWGSGSTTDASGKKTVTFATPFTDATTIGSWATNKAAGPPTAFHGTGNETDTTMDVWSAPSEGVASGAGTAFNFYAVGR